MTVHIISRFYLIKYVKVLKQENIIKPKTISCTDYKKIVCFFFIVIINLKGSINAGFFQVFISCSLQFQVLPEIEWRWSSGDDQRSGCVPTHARSSCQFYSSFKRATFCSINPCCQTSKSLFNFRFRSHEKSLRARWFFC